MRKIEIGSFLHRDRFVPHADITRRCLRHPPIRSVRVKQIHRVLFIALLALAAIFFFSSSFAFAVSKKQNASPVILISVDTLRADVLGCYGNRKALTPHIDTIARGGTLFYQISSQIPLTLPSHTSLLTSTYPFFNRIEENGEKVPSTSLTLAAILKSRGYHTAAFIGGFTLDRQFGLNLGFDLYDSPFGPHGKFATKRPGELVVCSAIHWLNQNSNHPFFLFLHLFDLHRPYTLPSARGLVGYPGYDIELRYVDQVLGEFWQYLAAKDLLAKSLIVFTSDHGESLGEHGEETHQYFIYQSTVWVPLIFHWPAGAGPYPARVNQPASLIDVAPTILQFLGIPRPRQFQGQSLFDLLNTRSHAAPRKVYSESVYARDHFGCSALRSLRIGHYKYIEAPKPELYDLQTDPHELRNLYSHKTALAESMRHQLVGLEAQFAPSGPRAEPKELSKGTLDLLGSLGYTELGYPGARPRSSGCDPKDRLAEYRLYGHAIMEAQTENWPAAIRAFSQVLREDPQNVFSRYYLAVCYFHTRKLDGAVKELERTKELSPYFSRAYKLLGSIWLEEGKYAQAQKEFGQLLLLTPDDYEANYNVGVLAIRKGDFQEGIRRFEKAAEADPQSFIAHNELGLAYLRTGNPSQAEIEFKQAISLRPKDAAPHYHCGTALLELDRKAAATAEFEEALADDPTFLPARQALDKLEKSAARPAIQ
ncbi:MAG: sulfatase-like hydrolase/transferase [Terriglobia bacterium]